MTRRIFRRSFVGALMITTLVATGCGATGSAQGPDAGPGALEGTWVVTWTVDDLAAALGGAGDAEALDLARGNAGRLELTFDDGSYDVRYVDLGDSCPGTYTVEGDRVVMTATIDPTAWDCGDGVGQLAADARWTVDGDALTLDDWKLSTQPGMDWFNHVLFGTKPLERAE